MIYLATDHAGFELKETVKEFLKKEGYEVEDLGAHQLDLNDDYPDFISKAAEDVSKDPQSRAIIFGGSGQGEAIIANKFPGVRTAVYYGNNEEIIKLSREHNNTNILSIGARFVPEEEALKIVKLWLETAFTNNERHLRRINKIKEIEKSIYK